MLKMSGFDVLFAAAGNLYLLLAVICIGVALWKGKTWTRKLVYAALVLAFAIAPIAPEIYRTVEYRSKLSKAEALFEERCKTAGERIYKTVDNVEGVLLTNVRPAKISDSSQFDADDQYGYNVGGEEYIRYYLIGSNDAASRYRFVEVMQGDKKHRFTTPLTAAVSREYWTKGGGKVPIESTVEGDFSALYAIEWKDISTKEDRDSWIAGGALRITNRKTGELLGERIGYLYETGFGSTAGQRSPWSWARYYAQSCPSVKEHNRIFVEKVLKPAKETK